MMGGNGKWRDTAAYGLFFILACVLFVYMRFPGELVKDALVRRLETRFPEVAVSIGELRPSFPFGLVLGQCTLAPKDKGEAVLQAERIDLSLVLWPVFPWHWQVAFKIVSGGSILAGELALQPTSKEEGLPFLVDLQAINLDDNPAFWEHLFGRPVGGRIVGKLSGRVIGGLTSSRGKANLVWHNGEITLWPATDAAVPLAFRELGGDFSLEAGLLKVEHCALRGREVIGRGSGTVTLSDTVFDQASLNLEGTVEILPEFFRKMRLPPQTMELIEDWMRDGKRSFTVAGTIATPRVTVK